MQSNFDENDQLEKNSTKTPSISGISPHSSINNQSKPSKKKSKSGRPSIYDKKIQALAIPTSCVEGSSPQEDTTSEPNQSIKQLNEFSCEVCEKKFSTRGSLQSHQRRHTGEKPFPCTALDCDKSFRTQSDRARHVKTHTGFKNFACDQCASTFSNKTNLKTHKNVVHFGVKPYTCETCSKTFGYLTNYHNHLRIHSGEKPYVCSHPGCNQRFGEYSIALRHALHVHTVVGSFKCPKCDKIYRSQSGLIYHKKIIHDRIRPDIGSRPAVSEAGSSFSPPSLLRDLIRQELPRFASLIGNDGARTLHSVLEEEREAAILLGFHEEDEILGLENSDMRGSMLDRSFPIADLICESDWNLHSLPSRECLDLFPELSTDLG